LGLDPRTRTAYVPRIRTEGAQVAELDGLIVTLVMSLPIAILFTLFAGIQRIPWRDAVLIGLGMSLVLFAGGIATNQIIRPADTGILVFIGAIGGGIAVRGYEHGKAQRDATIQAIVEGR
jgi:hypothetical protein